jgi:hypothetical protein
MLPGCGGLWPGFRCPGRPAGGWSWPSTSRHGCGRGNAKHQMMPGWPYSVVVALETGRTSWSALLDAVRLTPGADLAAVTARQVREVVERLVAAGQWTEGDIVLDAGYDAPRIYYLLSGLPGEVLGRTRSGALWRGGSIKALRSVAAAGQIRNGRGWAT